MTAPTEFTVDLADTDQGSLIVTDPTLLIRPLQSAGYHRNAQHDVQRANAVLSLGNSGYGEVPLPHHLIFKGTANEAHALLDRVFHWYIDACCLEQWCDARVKYIVDGDVVRTEEYGFEDGSHTLFFNVHCGVADPDALAATLVAESNAECVVVSPDNSERGYAVRGYRPAYEADTYVD